MKYGTEAQKKHYLPRLAKGADIPCFALTSPQAGSDAASMPDRGVVCTRTTCSSVCFKRMDHLISEVHIMERLASRITKR